VDHDLDTPDMRSSTNELMLKVVIPLVIVVGAVWSFFSIVSDLREKTGAVSGKIEVLVARVEIIASRVERTETSQHSIEQTLAQDRPWGAQIIEHQESLKELQKEVRDLRDTIHDMRDGDGAHKKR